MRPVSRMPISAPAPTTITNALAAAWSNPYRPLANDTANVRKPEKKK